MSNEIWKRGNEFLPFHKQASHVNPDYRDGWNACFDMAMFDITRLRTLLLQVADEPNIDKARAMADAELMGKT